MNKQSISILGCGWLGFPLAQALIEAGHQVLGSTTSQDKLRELAKAGVKPHIIELSPSINQDFDASFFRSDMLVINIPPGRRREDIETYFPRQVSEILDQRPPLKIIFVSSTSVYPNLNRKVKETDSPPSLKADKSVRASGKALLIAEELVRAYSSRATILRFCGLMGPNRHPGKFLAGKKLDSSGQDPVNFIHLDDCVKIIIKIIENEAWGEIFNACADLHPSKEKFYTQAANQLGLAPPEFNSSARSSYKEIESQKLKDQLNYQFTYPDPQDAI